MPVEKLISAKKRYEASYLLQFLPESLDELSKVDFFEFKSKKLKSAYVIDIVHSLLLKFFFKNFLKKKIFFLRFFQNSLRAKFLDL